MPDDALLDRREVEARTKLSRSSIYRLMRAQRFPEPVRIGDRKVAWREAEVREYLASRPRATGDRPAA